MRLVSSLIAVIAAINILYVASNLFGKLYRVVIIEIVFARIGETWGGGENP